MLFLLFWVVMSLSMVDTYECFIGVHKEGVLFILKVQSLMFHKRFVYSDLFWTENHAQI